MRHLFLAGAAALLALGAPVAAHADACQGLVPSALARQLARSYPELRIPLEFDNAPQDIEAARARGGTGCLGVAAGELSGEGKIDYAIGLTALHGNGGLAVVALPQRGGWRVQELEHWPEHARVGRGIERVEAGRYGELVCPNGGVRIVNFGGKDTLYCLVQGTWKHGVAPAR